MPLDITLFRKEGGNPEAIRESQRRRFQPVESVDNIIAKDDEWRLITGNIDKMRKARNLVQKDIAEVKKSVAKAAKEGKTAEVGLMCIACRWCVVRVVYVCLSCTIYTLIGLWSLVNVWHCAIVGLDVCC
ncbi:hypothetical protein EON63_07745 [archaeon]|nr:MAG: hypothetical protein EON63_07745 [archaeon]